MARATNAVEYCGGASSSKRRRAAVSAGRWSNTPMPDSVTSYLRHLEVERRVAANTHDAYRRDLARLCAFAAKRGAVVDRLDRADLELLVREAVAGGLSPTSIARLVAAVRGFFRFLRVTGRVTENPADDLQAPRTFARLPHFLSMSD